MIENIDLQLQHLFFIPQSMGLNTPFKTDTFRDSSIAFELSDKSNIIISDVKIRDIEPVPNKFWFDITAVGVIDDLKFYGNVSSFHRSALCDRVSLLLSSMEDFYNLIISNENEELFCDVLYHQLKFHVFYKTQLRDVFTPSHFANIFSCAKESYSSFSEIYSYCMNVVDKFIINLEKKES